MELFVWRVFLILNVSRIIFAFEQL